MKHRVYFVQSESGLVKIGYCRDMRYRMYGIRHATKGAVKLLATIGEGLPGDAARKLERHLHGRFAAHRVEGEWFLPAPEIMRFIAEPLLGDAA